MTDNASSSAMKARDRRDMRPTVQAKGTNEAGLGSNVGSCERPEGMNNGSRTSSPFSLHSLSEDVLFWGVVIWPGPNGVGIRPFLSDIYLVVLMAKLPQETVHVYPTKDQLKYQGHECHRSAEGSQDES